MPVNVWALGAVSVGSVSVYAGLKGVSIPAAVQAIVSGKSPATLPQTAKIDTPVELPSAGSSPAVAGGSASGQAIANDGLRYKGEGYVWGGKADHPGNWDCSSFVSYILGHDLGMAIPGGHYGDPGMPPHAHGPTTEEYVSFGQQISRSQVAAGDLIVWGPHHIGIAINNQSMISAQDERLGVGISSIDGSARYFGSAPSCRRVAAG